MPDLLLELFSEEIPARMQRQAAEDLKRLMAGALVEAGLTYDGAQSFATPRRLTLHVAGLPEAQPHRREERKGPRVGAPDAAVQGFLKAAGLARIEEAKIVSDGKKGEMYVAAIDRPGREARAVIGDLLPPILRAFPWPKSMRWGAASTRADALRWVRPLRAIVCTFGGPHEAPEVIPFTLDGLTAGDVTFGHRFLAPGPIRVKRFEDYVDALYKGKVVLDAERRKNMILADARSLALAQGLELIEDEGLVEEVAGLVEWPVVSIGGFEPEFLEIPAQAIRATIRANQKCFVLRDASGGLADRFVLVSNLVASDGGAAITAGNARVVRARLSDARHFLKTDLADLPDYKDKGLKPLDQRLAKLRTLGVVFHEKLGTQGERIARIRALASALAPPVGCVPELADRAAELAKADLVTEMVGEFPELQGLMGRFYAEKQGENADVARAIEEHYKPQGPNDRTPTAPESIAVALADKLDTLVGFWAIDEKPTGSKDPYALRRAALGVIRIVLENGLRLPLGSIASLAFAGVTGSIMALNAPSGDGASVARAAAAEVAFGGRRLDARALDLLAFFADRLKVYLRDKGARHDLIEAVFALPCQDDLLLIVRRVEALGRFLDGEDGRSLLAGYRRAANILKAEEKKYGAGAFSGAPEKALLQQVEERALDEALDRAVAGAKNAIAREDFEGAMLALSPLRQPVDAFFLGVTVNAEDSRLRVNRLRLLGALRHAVHGVADFSRVAG